MPVTPPMTHAPAPPHRRSLPRALGRWLISFVGFPLGGLAAMTLVGPVNGPLTALGGGLIAGAVLGLAQGLGLGLGRRRLLTWSAVTAMAFGVGLPVAGVATGFSTDLSSLIVLGLLSGVFVGAAQAGLVARMIGRLALGWPVLVGLAWGLGWAVTTSIGVEVGLRWTVFGSAGAVTVTILTALLPVALWRREQIARVR